MEKLFNEMFDTAKTLLVKNEDIIDMMNHSLVIAMIVSESGKIYYGMNVSWWHSVCAEPTAVSNAFQAGERKFKYLMAVKLVRSTRKFEVISPCGICREMFKQLNMDDLQVVLKTNNKYKIKTIGELLEY